MAVVADRYCRRRPAGELLARPSSQSAREGPIYAGQCPPKHRVMDADDLERIAEKVAGDLLDIEVKLDAN